jgi:predicted AlkP superfamily pyrophosphatase or phosphodiesterase
MIRSRFLFIVLLMAHLHSLAQAKHVILISIDGLHPDMYLDKSWPAPNIQQLAKKGTYADHMLSVFPSYTYPSHTAMVTGALPARSGIYFNQPKQGNGDWNWFMSAVKVPTLWQVMEKAGKTTAAIEWPVSVGQGITYNIPEIWSDRYPDRITEARKYATPGLIEEIEQYATGKLDSINMSEDYFSMDANSARMAGYIFKTYHPDLLAVHFAEVDGYQHEYGRDADSVRIALAAVDRAIGDVIEAINQSPYKESTTIIIVGDHGFSTFHMVFRPNMLIKDLSANFFTAGGSAFLYRSKTAQKEDDESTIKKVIQRLDSLPKDKRKLFRIIERNELDKMGADSSAIMALAAVPGMVFSGSTGKAPVTNHGPGTVVQHNPLEGVFIPASGGHHGYDPNFPDMYTGFIAAGAGIKKGGHVTELCVTDIAPLIAKLLNVDFKVPDGKLIPGIIISK